MSDPIERIRAFIGADPVRGSSAFLTTMTRSGEPYARQVSCFIEGWTVQTISQVQNLKVTHLRANPRAMYLWAEENPPHRRRNVWMRGSVTIEDDPAAVVAFMERRAAALGFTVPERDWVRVVLSFTPDFLRAEGFQHDDYTGREAAIFIRDF